MNHCFFSYCLEMGSGGIKVKSHKIKEFEFIRFFLEEATKPAAVLNLDGTVEQMNDLFRDEFRIEKMHNFKDILDERSKDVWDLFSGRKDKTGNTTFDMRFVFSENRIHLLKVRFMYFDTIRKVLALFNVPLGFGVDAKTTYLNAFRKSDDFMILIDRNGIVRDVNDLYNKFFNVPREYFIGKTGYEIFNLFPEAPEEHNNYIQKAVKNGYAEVVKRYENVSGDIKYYKITTLFDEETRMYLIKIVDYTEKVNLEQRLAHKGSLSALGQLAASIAHEIRNPMTTLKGFTQLLRLSATEESMKYLAVIDDEIVRMESILSEMLILSKPALSKKTTLSLEVLVDDVLNVVNPKALLEGIKIVQKDVNMLDTLIFGNPDKIKQVLLNLFKNSLEAMTSGGTLTVGMEQIEDNKIVLSISDTGKGMNESQLNQIFMPFFTTKAEGTGLGLPFVLKTIEEHDGTIAIESKVGEGTTIMISFPLAIAHVSGTILNDKVLSQTGSMA
jgi:two-component system, sporulation sensor kinase E